MIIDKYKRRFNFSRFVVKYIGIRYKKMYRKIILILLAIALAVAGVWYIYSEYFRDNSSEQNMIVGGEKAPGNTNTETTRDDAKICAQVITTAKNQSTGETKDFPTPCDVPVGWEVVNEASY